MNKIKPCQCGGNGKIIKMFPSKRYDCFIKCDKCGIETKVYTSRQNAIKMWSKGKVY